MLRKWIRQEKVHAIHARDIEGALKELGLLDQLAAGELTCALCGQPISINDIQCLFMQDDRIKVCCKGPDCFQRVTMPRIA